MERNRTLATIRNDIERHVGEKVTLKANGGRKKILVNDGIIESVHPSIFVVRLDNDTQRTVTYSYSDVLTKTGSRQCIRTLLGELAKLAPASKRHS